MSCFDFTKQLCEEISALIARYWWSQQDKTNKCRWISWEKMRRSKKNGGLGFQDLYIFNLAMLSWQGWRLIEAPDTLCAQVLKARYYPNCSVLEATEKDGISYTWRSILKGIALLKEGIIWHVGSGEHIKIWEDAWIPRGTTRRPISQRGNAVITRV
jgi:hypothetical protein